MCFFLSVLIAWRDLTPQGPQWDCCFTGVEAGPVEEDNGTDALYVSDGGRSARRALQLCGQGCSDWPHSFLRSVCVH